MEITHLEITHLPLLVWFWNPTICFRIIQEVNAIPKMNLMWQDCRRLDPWFYTFCFCWNYKMVTSSQWAVNYYVLVMLFLDLDSGELYNQHKPWELYCDLRQRGALITLNPHCDFVVHFIFSRSGLRDIKQTHWEYPQWGNAIVPSTTRFELMG